MPFLMRLGTEWLIDAFGCEPKALADVATLRALLEDVLLRMELRTVGEGLWHKFPGPGGVTGMYLLTESHLACHTYPEHGALTINLYCCRKRLPFPWQDEIGARLGAARVVIREVDRGA